ncbi:MAG: ribosome biogenesis GTPase Der [Desulfobacca sp.]|uniref:ribosome biogenesis GTPase Der n=1 Tax=Desulfobacca sp. TaxID=2067990 RepID=UPI0040495C0C
MGVEIALEFAAAMPKSTQPFVALIGRTNVGKSTLFNRLTRQSRALVDDQPGVTRDRLYSPVTWEDRSFILIDTGGFGGTSDDLGRAVRRQAEAAAAEADLILFLVDATRDVQADDLEVATFLRRTGKPVLLVVNKVDGPKQEALVPAFYELGFSPLYPISAAHGLGVANLLAAIVAQLPPVAAAAEPPVGLRVAVLGRPNVGKSSFINRVLSEERLLVSDSPGTTRDAVDTPLLWEGHPYILIDTAGIRRRSRIQADLERGMVWQALRALERAEVVLFLVDVSEGLAEQDLRILHLVAQAGKGCLIGLNKWDLLQGSEKEKQHTLAWLRTNLRLMPYAPLLPLSVATGYQVAKVFPLIEKIAAQWQFRAGTGELNRVFTDIVKAQPPPRFRHRSVRFYYITQAGSRPPTFIIFTNYPGAVPESYRRYLSNQLRERLDLPYAPLRLYFKGKERRRSRTGSGAPSSSSPLDPSSDVVAT